MINANELRIGNWVNGPLGEEMQIDILGHSKYPDFIHAKGYGIYGQNGFSPIPLTPEILEKCGFNNISPNKDGTFNYSSKELDASIDCEDGNLFRYRIHEKLRTKNIMSLHQLQNLYYALTGTELTYKP